MAGISIEVQSLKFKILQLDKNFVIHLILFLSKEQENLRNQRNLFRCMYVHMCVYLGL